MAEHWDIRNYKTNNLYKVVIVILVFLLVRSCGNGHSGEKKNIKVKTTSDTVYVKGDEVKVYFHDTITLTEVVYTPTPPDTVYIIGDVERLRYTTHIDDSLIKGDIVSMVELPSKNMISQTLSYKPKFPKRILRVDTVKINKETVIEIKNQKSILYGGGITASPNYLGIKLSGGFRFNNGREAFYSYDLLQKSHTVSYLFNIGL